MYLFSVNAEPQTPGPVVGGVRASFFPVILLVFGLVLCRRAFQDSIGFNDPDTPDWRLYTG